MGPLLGLDLLHSGILDAGLFTQKKRERPQPYNGENVPGRDLTIRRWPKIPESETMRKAEGTRRGRATGRSFTRRLFVGGSFRASLAAGLGARFSILDLLGQTAVAGLPGQTTGTPVAGRNYDGEIIAEAYEIAHRLRDGTLAIPALAAEGPLHDAIVVGGGVSGLMSAWELERGGLTDVLLYEKEDYIGGNARKGHANGTDYTCATFSVAGPRDRFLTRLFTDLGVITGFAGDGTPRIELYLSDQLHFRPAGYDELARVLKPILTQAFNTP